MKRFQEINEKIKFAMHNTNCKTKAGNND